MKVLKVTAGLLLALVLTVGLARLAPIWAAPQVVNTIAGSVFLDSNLNGSQDVGEPGAPDVKLELYSDDNGNGLIDKHDHRLSKLTSDAEGVFAFRVGQSGVFLVKVDTKSLPKHAALTTLNRQAASFNELGQTDADNHFGYTDAPYVDDEALVSFTAGTAKARIKEIIDGYGLKLKLKRYQEGIDVYLLTTPPGEVDAVISYLGGYAEVAYAERNGKVGGGWTPGDPDYADPTKSYGLRRIQAETAWETTKGDAATLVALVDSGLALTHPEFAGRVSPGWDFVNNDADPSDDNGHGTHVAGIIAAAMDNGEGSTGVAPGVTLMPVKALNAANAGTWANVAAGIVYAVDHGASVINLSLGGHVASITLHDAIAYAAAHDVVVVAGSGNLPDGEPFYPAAYPEVLAVSATDATDAWWTSSDYGDWVDVAAPGDAIWSTLWTSAAPETYATKSGTSMATGFVSGLAALVRSARPELSALDVQVLIQQASDDKGEPGPDAFYGWGRINAGAALGIAGAWQRSSPTPTATTRPLATATPTATATPPPVPYLQRVSAGSSAAYTDVNGQTWAADKAFQTGAWGYTGGKAKSYNTVVAGAADGGLYQKQREEMTEYKFTVPNGMYRVNLKFAEFAVTSANQRAMLISMEGAPVENPLNVYVAAGKAVALDRAYSVLVTDGVLNVAFTKNSGAGSSPMVSAIELISQGSLVLTDAGGVPVATTRIGEQLGITLFDADANTSATSTQSLIMTAADPISGDQEQVTLTETGPNSGIFTGSLLLSRMLGQAVNDGYLNTATDHVINVRYEDTDDFPADLRESSVVALAPGSADIKVSLDVDDTTPSENQELVYTIKVKNEHGPDAATSLVISEPAPNGSVYLSGTPSSGTFDLASGRWLIGTLPKDAEAVLTLRAKVTARGGQTVVNTAAVQTMDQDERHVGDETASLSVTVNPVDLRVTAAADDTTPDEGQIVRFTLAVKNSGPADLATGILLNSALPAGLTPMAVTPSQGSYNAVTGVWTVGSVAKDATAQLVTEVAMPLDASGQTFVYGAALLAVDQIETDAGDNSSDVSLTVNGADIIVKAAVDDDRPDENQLIAYTISAKNDGPAGLATGIVLRADPLPGGLTFVSVTPGQGNYDQGTGVWTVGSLTKGAKAELVIRAAVNPKTSGQTFFYGATLLAVDQVETDAKDNTDSVRLTVNGADIVVGAAVDDTQPDENQPIAYTISAKNDGPAGLATGIVLRVDPLPAELTLISVTPGQGSYDPIAGVWAVGSLAKGVTAQLVIRAVVKLNTGGQTLVYGASLLAVDQAETKADNNSANVSLTVNGVDIAVSAAVDNSQPGENQVVAYTISAKNNGPADLATGILISDILPAGLTFVSAATDQGSYDPAAGVWTVGSLAKDVSTRLAINAAVDPGTTGQTIVSPVALLAVDQHETKADNNRASTSMTVVGTDIVVSAAVNENEPGEGQAIVYTISAKNEGPLALATGMSLAALLPDGLTFVSATADQGSYDPITGFWSVGKLAKGATVRLNISAQVNLGTAGQTVSSLAELTALDQHEMDATNNARTVAIIIEPTDIKVTLSVKDSKRKPGESTEYTVEVKHNGPAQNVATGVVISDVLPDGVMFVSAAPEQGTYEPGTGRWDVGSLASGVTKKLKIKVTVGSATPIGATIVNTASLLSLDQTDTALLNNSASATLTVRK